MAEWIPTNNSLELLEFTHHNRTIAVVETPIKEYQIQNVTYTTSNGIEFDDMQIRWGKTAFTFDSLFEYAVNRVVQYIKHNDFASDKVDYEQVENIKWIPESSSANYNYHNPDDSMQVYFHVTGLQRDGVESSSGDGTTSTIIWSSWYDWSDTYTITIETNFNKHMQLIRNSIKKQHYVINLEGNTQYPNI